MKVIATIQSTMNPDEQPVDVRWYTGPYALTAITAAAQALDAASDSTYTKTLAIRIEL